MVHIIKLVSFVYLILSFCNMSSCKTQMPQVIADPVVETETDTVIFNSGIVAGILNNDKIDEASGLVRSIEHPGTLWTHNDSGDNARIFLINDQAEYLLTCTLNNATNRDWEDIAIAKDPATGISRIYIGDIGDNRAKYDYVEIYILDEPQNIQSGNISIDKFDKIVLKYPDGPRDAESLMVHPLTGDIYIISKRENNVGVYLTKYPYNFSDTIIMEKILTLPFTQVVAGDISADGKEILLKTYQKIYYFKIISNESITDALSRNAQVLPYIVEPQGEAICWSADAKSYYTLSEFSPFKITPILYRYDRKQ